MRRRTKMRLFLVFCLFISCGSSSVTRSSGHRIIGGQIVRSDQFPFAAAIYVTTGDSRFFCGGTLISNQFIITAGQCVYNAVLFTIQLGSIRLVADDPGRLTLATSTYILHPDYNPETLQNDIGLIKLRIPIEFAEYIQPIYSLPEDNIFSDLLAALGWGQISDQNPELSDDLNWVYVSTLTNFECTATYGNQITDNMLCVEGNFNEGTCTGDTGGPLVQLIRYGNGILIGVASFGSANGCESTDPSGYTRIYPYVDWIKNVTDATYISK